LGGPSETVSVTADPFLAFAPAPGSCWITWSTGCGLDLRSTLTEKPRCSSSAWAWSAGEPTTLGTGVLARSCE